MRNPSPLSNEQKDAGPSLPAFWADRIASLFRRKFALQFTHFDKVFCGISKPPLRRQQQLKNSLGEVAILHVLEMRIHPKPQRKIKLGKGRHSHEVIAFEERLNLRCGP